MRHCSNEITEWQQKIDVIVISLKVAMVNIVTPWVLESADVVQEKGGEEGDMAQRHVRLSAIQGEGGTTASGPSKYLHVCLYGSL